MSSRWYTNHWLCKKVVLLLCSFCGRNLSLASIWQIIRRLVKNTHSISASYFCSNFIFRLGFWIGEPKFTISAKSGHDKSQDCFEDLLSWQRECQIIKGEEMQRYWALHMCAFSSSTRKELKSRAKTGFTSSLLYITKRYEKLID